MIGSDEDEMRQDSKSDIEINQANKFEIIADLKNPIAHNHHHLRVIHPVESRRATSGRIIRLIYAISVIALSGYLIWTFGRQFVFLEGEGTILAKRVAVSIPYSGQISTIDVVHGSRVEAGDDLLSFKSFEIQKQISEILKLVSDQAKYDADFAVREATSKAAKAAAGKRAAIADEAVKHMETLPVRLLSYQERMPFYREKAAADHDLAVADAEIKIMQEKRRELEFITSKFKREITDIEVLFNDGNVIAPIGGVIGNKVPSKGDPIIPGKPILEIFDLQDVFIDWEIPLRRFVSPKIGDRVYITSGYQTYEGTVSDIFQVAKDSVDNEINLFEERLHGQVARVRSPWLREHLNPTNNPIIGSKVTVRMDYGFIMDPFFSFVKYFRKPSNDT